LVLCVKINEFITGLPYLSIYSVLYAKRLGQY
jgi:hypothetical protein